MNSDDYIDILNSKLSEIKKPAGRDFKLMLDNDSK